MRWVRELAHIATLTASTFNDWHHAPHTRMAIILSRTPHVRRQSFAYYERREAEFMALYGAREPRQPEWLV